MSTHITEAASSWYTRFAVMFLLLIAAVGVVFAFQQSAQAAELDSMTMLHAEQGSDAVVSGGSSSTNISAMLVRVGDGSLVDTSAPNSAVTVDESAVYDDQYSLLAFTPPGEALVGVVSLSVSSTGLPDSNSGTADMVIDQSNNNSIAGGELGRVIVLPPSGLDTNTSPQSAAPGSTDGLLAGANTVFALAIIIAFILTAASLGVMHSRRREIRGGEASSASGRPFSD